MSGLIALLDDVAAIAKLAAASLDDVVAQATKAGAKAAGAVIDDAAVTPKYIQGFAPARELPIVWRIARGSLFNKLVILLPAALMLQSFAPWAIAPLLMLGGAYLCFEGTEKIHHWLFTTPQPETGRKVVIKDTAHLEETKVKGAIKTDFILSAEIMTIALAALPAANIWFQGTALALVAFGITLAVYGSVALIVKADDVGLMMSTRGRLRLTRAVGRSIVRGMPGFMKLLLVVGTAAMLWVGGSIIVHGLAETGVTGPEHIIDDIAQGTAAAVGAAQGFVAWLVKAGIDGVLGLFVGFALIPIVTLGARLGARDAV